MGKTILVLTGSVRKNGNSEQLAEAFIEGAVSSGKQILRFDAAFKDIGACAGCGGCFSAGTPCVSPDDFTELGSYLQQADAVAIFTPIYWFSFPAKLKAAIDKMYSFCASGTPMKVKESIFVVCGEDTNMSTFDPVVSAYDKMADYLGWENKGHIVVPGVNDPGEAAVKHPEAIEGMKKIGTYY